ncbi:hypothetical protein H0I31_09010 [Tenacibaculum sp. AHE15PA]|uniref:hypothetical protein n=1 Tax=unclassified Tenacibaculum TaxID=2635139 RepID=UPI001C4EC589|nr:MULTISPECIES: hypothetical protein [unclassified Tenacibaculum]QXP74312.1 hypothetical protein H0I30_03960 [Tenacibaculum sp. AHE14PA]QXP75318.1 hypothetical protein H0I31_09010 [Tenacibaculum sp. AHE15PA]
MKKAILIIGLLCFTLTISGQNTKKIEKTYGGIPTANENMKWQENRTANEYYTGVIQVDSTINASKIIDAFISTFQPMQDANIMTKQMRSNSAWGGALSAVNGDSKSISDFASAGDSDLRNQNQRQTTWTVQFIDGVRLSRFYYNVSVQTKDGRYKITVTPAGSSGYVNDHIQTEWSQMFKKGKVRSIYSKYYEQMKIKLAYTIDQWINKVDKHLISGEKDDW